MIVQTSGLNYINYIQESFLPSSESTDCVLVIEPWLLSLSSAAESWALSADKAPLDSRTAICVHISNTDSLVFSKYLSHEHLFRTRGLTLFCRLSSCSVYHLSFSSKLFFSSSSFFTKSISLGRKQENVVSHQTFQLVNRFHYMCLSQNYFIILAHIYLAPL